MLPWLNQDLELARELMGDDYWSYRLAANHEVLETFLRYHWEQGLSKHLLTPKGDVRARVPRGRRHLMVRQRRPSP